MPAMDASIIGATLQHVDARTWAVAALIAAVLLFQRTARSRSSLPLPPGPPGRFMLGNLSDIPKGPEEWKQFAQLGKIYGPVVHLGILDRSIVVLSTVKAASDLLDKRSAIYSDRVRFPMLGELMGFEWLVAMQGYGPYWRLHRRAIHQQFNEQASKLLRPELARTTSTFLQLLANEPEDWWEHCRWLAGANIMSVTYGMNSAFKDDPYIKMGEETIKIGSKVGNVSVYMVDILPFLKHIPDWFPGAKFKRDAKEWKQVGLRARDLPFAWVKEQLAAGTARPSMTANLLEGEIDGQPVPEDVIKNSAGTVYFAGADTSVSTMHAFFLALVRHPDAQRAAQAEVDAVVGEDARLPTLEDRPRMPVVEALYREVLRRYPPLTLGLPHRLMQDDEYEGMRIPENAFVLTNIWAMLHDPEMYPEPETFDPLRWLTADGTLDEAIMDPRAALFGFGRRICPGRYFADDEIWLMVAAVLYCFDVRQRGDAPPSDVMCSGIVASVGRFECDITLRSGERRAVVAAVFEHDRAG